MDHGVVARGSSATPAVAPLTPELITEIIHADLTRRGIQAPGQVPSLSDKGWLDLVHSAYYAPVSAAAYGSGVT